MVKTEALSDGDGVAPAIGIDLGTTYSCVAVWEHDHVEIITNEQGNRTTPSYIYVSFTEDEILVGNAAKKNAISNPANTIYAVKRLIGRRFLDPTVQSDIKMFPFNIIKGPNDRPKVVARYKGKEKQFSPEEISSWILMKMKQTAEKYLGRNVRDAVITVPSYFNDSQRRATKAAGVIAGLNVKRIMDEPTAAALAYGFHKIKDHSRPQNVLVFDLGGGTFDVSLVKVFGALFEVKAVAGDTHLGGEDFNNRMLNHFVEELRRKHHKDMTDDAKALRRLRSACERAKRRLSNDITAPVQVHFLYDGLDFLSTITRARFNELNIDLFAKCIELVDQCLKDAKIEKSGVDIVILVGGSTRIPKLEQLLQDYFGDIKLHRNINPDEAVAYGAAIQAAKLSGQGNEMINSMVLVDVTPLSLGVEVEGDVMYTVIPQNTPIPIKNEKKFTTSKDNQTAVKFAVYEGERHQASKNHLLGSFKLFGISPAPKLVPKIDVCFEIDHDGILNVSAMDHDSIRMGNITIVNEESWLRKEEIDKMIKDAEEYKSEDEIRNKKVTALNKLDYYVYNTRNTVRKQCNVSLLPESKRQKVEEAVAGAISWLDKNPLPPARLSGAKLQKIQEICEPIIKEMKNSKSANCQVSDAEVIKLD